MFTQIRQCLLLSGAVLATVLVGSAYADESRQSANVPASSPSSAAQTKEEMAKAIDQLRSIQELRDVNPVDWSYEALRNLVEQYGCIVGYPDRTYRGDRPLTRDEFAAGLNACIQALERRILQAQSGQSQGELAPIDEIRPVAYEDSYEQFAEMFNRAFYNRTGQFWDIYTSPWGQLNAWLGWRNFPGSYLENDISRDAKTMSIIYYNGLQQQTPLPRLRTRDLPSPFNTSIQQNPSYLGGTPSSQPNDIIIRPPAFP